VNSGAESISNSGEEQNQIIEGRQTVESNYKSLFEIHLWSLVCVISRLKVGVSGVTVKY